MPREAGQKPRSLGTIMSLCGATAALLTACRLGDDSRIASALQPPALQAPAPALINYGAVFHIASDGEEAVLYSFGPQTNDSTNPVQINGIQVAVLSPATDTDGKPPVVEPAVYRDGTAPRWEFAEGVKASP